MKTKGVEALDTLEAFVAHDKLCLGNGERMSDMKVPIAIGIRESHKELFLTAILAAGVLLKNLGRIPLLLRFALNAERVSRRKVDILSDAASAPLATLP